MALDLVLDEKYVDLDLPHGPAEYAAPITAEPMVPLVSAFASTKTKSKTRSKTLS